MSGVIDIHSTKQGPAGQLSNLAPHEFEFRGFTVPSIESVLQSVKFQDLKRQNAVLAMQPWDAFSYGKRYGQGWKSKGRGLLWWQGQPMARDSDEYQAFLNELYYAACKNEDFHDNLVRSWPNKLVHTIGGQDIFHTVLTEEEFTNRLESMRLEILAANYEAAERSGQW